MSRKKSSPRSRRSAPRGGVDTRAPPLSMTKASAKAVGKVSGKRKPRLMNSGALFVPGSDESHFLSLGRLHQIETALKRGFSLDEASRRDLLDLIDYVRDLCIERPLARRRRGRPPDYMMGISAGIVRELHERHGIKIAAATSAIVRADVGTEDSRRKLRQNIESAYRMRKKSGMRFPVPDRLVSEALARINPPRNRK